MRILLRCFIAVLLLNSSFVFAGDQPGRLIVFGDSLSDPGNAYLLLGQQSLPPYNLIPDAPYAIGAHHFSNGKTWIEQLADKLDSEADPAFAYTGDTNFAVGGARARSAGGIDLGLQVGLYLSQFAGGQAGDDVVVLFIGGNDVRDAIALLAADPTGASSGQLLLEALTSIQDNLQALISAGTQRFVIANAPDLSLVPALRGQPEAVRLAAQQLSLQFNLGLANLIAGITSIAPVTIHTLDIFTLINEAVAAPSAFDLEVVDTACINPGVVAQSFCADQTSYLFWDGIHPTRTGHRIIAERALPLFSN